MDFNVPDGGLWWALMFREGPPKSSNRTVRTLVDFNVPTVLFRTEIFGGAV